jgi:hypothetical protein
MSTPVLGGEELLVTTVTLTAFEVALTSVAACYMLLKRRVSCICLSTEVASERGTLLIEFSLLLAVIRRV